MCLLAAEPRSIAGLLFPCQYLCGTILVTPCSMVWDWPVSKADPNYLVNKIKIIRIDKMAKCLLKAMEFKLLPWSDKQIDSECTRYKINQ